MNKERLYFAIRITFFYFLGGGIWILVSDRIVATLFSNNTQITLVQTVKGILFVFLSGVFLFLLLWLEGRRRQSAQAVAEETIRQTEERFSKVFYNSPIAISITTLDEGRFIDANQAYWRLSGLRPEKTLGRTVAELKVWKDPLKRALLVERLKKEKSIGGIQDKFYTVDDEERDTLNFYELIQINGVDCILSMFHDVTEERQAQAALQRRDAILEAIAFAAQHFLRSEDWQAEIQPILERMGRAAESSRVYIFQKEKSASGRVMISQLFEWCAPGIRSQIANPALQKMDFAAAGYARWIRKFEQGEPVFGIVRDLPINEQPEFVREEILSIICVPIMIENDWWGFVGLDDCLKEREWSPNEIEALRTAAHIISSAIQRQQANKAVQKQFQELVMLHAVAVATSAATRADDLIGRVTEIIYDTLRPDTCGVLLLSKDGRLLVPHPSYLGAPFEVLAEPVILPKGIVGRVVASKRPARVGDVSLDPDYFEVTEGIRSELCVPLLAGKRVLGVLNLESKRENAFSEADERLLNTIAGGLATAIEKIELVEATQRRSANAEKLQEATAALSNSLNLDTLLDTILDLLPQFAPYDSASIMLVRDHEMEIVAGRNLPPDADLIGKRIEISKKWLQIFSAHRPLILADAQSTPFFEKWEGTEYIRGWMSVPMIVKEQIIGFLNLDSKDTNAFSEEQATLVQTFANQAAVAIENARLYEETRQRLKETETVSRVSVALRAARDSKEMLPILLWEVQKVMETEAVSIWLYNLDSERLEMQLAEGWIKNLPVTRLKPEEGIVGHVYRSGQIYVVADFLEDPHLYTPNRPAVKRGWKGVCLPLRSASETMGVFLAAIPGNRSVSIQQIETLKTLAEIAGNAIQRANLYQQAEEQVRRLTALRDVDIAISSSFDLRVTLNVLLDHILGELKANAADVLVYNPNLQMLTFQVGMGFSQRLLPITPLRLGEGLGSKALLERRDVYIENLKDVHLSQQPDFVRREGFVSYYATPLISKGQIKGILEIYFRTAFTPDRNWLDFLQALARQAAIAIDNSQLFENLQRSNEELSLAYDTTLEGWGKALELRDKETSGHTLRVTDLTLRLARRLGIPEAELTNIRRGVLLHDIGKMAVPDHILKKTGPLTDDEWGEMRRHPQYAYDLLYPIAYLRPALDIPYCHHERWDGQGYPRGLKGKEIPLAARIFAVVDIWDALCSNRPYRAAWTREQIIQYLREEAGTRLDPAVVAEFLKMIAEGEVGYEA
jgi:PAS domain S-box-containing protein